MIGVRVEDSGLKVKLEGLRGVLEDMTPVWPNVHKIFTEFIEKHFATQGEYAREKWVPLNPSYAAWKAKHYSGKGMMHLTERLYGSLTQEGQEHVRLEGPTYAEYGTRVPYAWAHQKGYPPRNLPTRVVIPKLTKAEGERIVDAILTFILKKLRFGRRA